ncbi:MAG: hypothetical protein NVV62_08475 [Terricaulis sp.]|nr:hypothetical protein [Terricaulis sp.]
MPHSASKLPSELLDRLVYSTPGGEYAWRVDDIPKVIEAARRASLLNLDGTLQFYLPDHGICECYWVDVGPADPPNDLDWRQKVEWSAEACQRRFDEVSNTIDLVAAGRDEFGGPLKELADSGTDIAQFMCFVWNVCDEAEYLELQRMAGTFRD